MANRFVRSTGGNSNAAGTWESASGAKDAVAVPTASDDIYLDAQSGQLTINAALVCRSFDCSNYANTVTHNTTTTLTVGTTSMRGDNLALKLAGTYTAASATAAITFTSTAVGTQTVDLASKTVGNLTFSGGDYQMQNNYTMYSAATTLSHTAGVLDINGKTMTAGIFSTTGTTARTLTLGAAALNLTQTGAAAFTYSGSGLTVTANTATVTLSSSSPTFAGGGADYNGMSLVISGTGGTATIQGSNTIKDFSITSAAAQTVVLTSGTVTTLTGNFSATGSSGKVLTVNTGGGAVATLAITTGTVTANYLSMTSITSTGANAPFFAGAYSALISGMTGWYSTKVISNAGGNFSATTCWVEGIAPKQYDMCSATGTSGNVTIAGDFCGALDLTNYVGTVTMTTGWALTIGCNVYPPSGVALKLAGTYTPQSATAATTFVSTASGTQTIDFASKTLGNLTFSSGNYQMLGDWTMYSAATTLTHTGGTLDVNGRTMTVGGFNTSGSTARTLTLGAAALNLSLTGGTAFGYTGSGLTITANTAVVTFSGVSPTFAGNSVNWNGLSLVKTAASGTATTITGANTFKDITLSASAAAQTITFPGSATTTITGTLTLTGNSNLTPIVINSSAGTATISSTTGTHLVQHATLTNIAATGGATFTMKWTVYGAGNSGWTLLQSPKYVRAAGGNSNAAATWSLTSGGAADATVPIYTDEIFVNAASVGTLTINAALVCNSFNATGNGGTISHGAFTCTIGSPFAPTSGVALVLGGTYTAAGATSAFTFTSSALGTKTVDYASKTIGNQTFSDTVSASQTYQLLNNFTTVTSAVIISHTWGTLDYNGVTQTGGGFSTSGATPRTITFGAAALNLSLTGGSAFSYTGSGLTVTANTAIVTLSGLSPTFASNGQDWNGLSLVKTAASGTATTITGAGTFKNITLSASAAAQTFTFPGSATTTITGTLTLTGNSNLTPIVINSSAGTATLSSAAGTHSVQHATVTNIACTGGATFNLKWVVYSTGNSGWSLLQSPKYVRAAGGNSNATATWSLTSGGAADAAVPSTTDEIFVNAASVGTLTINAALVCNAFNATGNGGTISHTNSITVTVGTPFLPTGNAALILAGTYTPAGASTNWTFSSTAVGTQTLDFGAKIIYDTTFSGGTWQLINNRGNNSGGGGTITHTAGTLDFNGYTFRTSIFNSSGATARALTLGSGTLEMHWTGGTTAFNASGSNLTVTATTGKMTFLGANGTLTGNAIYSGLSLVVSGSAATMTITGSNTFKDLIVIPTTTKTITLTSATTQTFTGNIHCYGSTGEITLNSSSAGSAAILSKATGTVQFYNTSIKDITTTGGATFTAYHNVLNVSGNTGITFTTGNVWYVDHENGTNSENTPYGWWKVAYTGATGTIPADGDTATGAISGRTATVKRLVNPYEWELTTGSLYFTNVSGAFVAEQLDFSSGGHVDIAGDFTKCGWLDLNTGAAAARIGPGDTMHCKKSLDPTSIGHATWTTRPYTLPVAFNIASSTNTTPIRITKVAHGLVNGDAVYVQNHLVNTKANGSWTITRITADTFDLDNSVGNGIGVATGTVTQVNHLCCVLETGCTQTICRCGEEGVWTPGSANYTCAVEPNASGAFKEGCYSTRITMLAGAGAVEKAAYFTLPAELNLSGYQQISFWFNPGNSVPLNVGDFSVCLCSDTLGATPVNTATFPTISACDANEWTPFVKDFAVALGSSIKSVAVYQNVDKGAFQLNIDNIFVSKGRSEADCLTLHSLVSKNNLATGGDEPFYPLQSVSQDGRVLMFRDAYNVGFTVNPSYVGVSEHVPTYVRQPIVVAKSSTSTTTSINTVNESGTVGKVISYLFGYNMANDTFDGETYLVQPDMWGVGFYAVTKSYIYMTNLSLIGFYEGIQITTTCTYIDFGNIQTIANAYAWGFILGSTVSYCTVGKVTGIIFSGCGFVFYAATYCTLAELVKAHSCWGWTSNNWPLLGFYNSLDCSVNAQVKYLCNITNTITAFWFSTDGTNYTLRNYVKGVDLISNSDSGVYFGANARYNVVDNLGTLTYNRYSGGSGADINFGANSWYNTIKSVTEISSMVGVETYGIVFGTHTYGNRVETCTANRSHKWAVVCDSSGDLFDNYIGNMETTSNTNCISFYWGNLYLNNCKFNETPIIGSTFTATGNGKIFSTMHQQTATNHKIYLENGLISSDSTTRHTAQGISWSLSPTAVTRTLRYPITLSLAKIAVSADTEVTVKVWCKKSHATDIAGKIVCRAGQLTGMTTYQEDTVESSTNWDELQVKFTPTEAGVVEIEGWAWWVANAADESVWFDDVTISQA